MLNIIYRQEKESDYDRNRPSKPIEKHRDRHPEPEKSSNSRSNVDKDRKDYKDDTPRSGHRDYPEKRKISSDQQASKGRDKNFRSDHRSQKDLDRKDNRETKDRDQYYKQEENDNRISKESQSKHATSPDLNPRPSIISKPSLLDWIKPTKPIKRRDGKSDSKRDPKVYEESKNSPKSNSKHHSSKDISNPRQALLRAYKNDNFYRNRGKDVKAREKDQYVSSGSKDHNKNRDYKNSPRQKYDDKRHAKKNKDRN